NAMLIAPYKNEPFDLYDTDSAKAEMQQALKKVHAEFGQTYPLIVNGERIQTLEKLTSTNPSNPSEVVGYTAKATKEHADAALNAAWQAFES
ncbi:L-glutamate gamma-semialdehyde dehydrogenase, partial [Paraburkholderia sp. SIMBA_061]